ncbi:Scr1 family TA system antitoxin-like transcriptional regulator [Phytohabitans sp. LJ34]|uniref:Scr1 family TA system antitoxin-like transcriptional regulator n=1 Tax=Phytohabitans sp. LJ34 TaxID=3452217 RepID=UPI003F8B2F56
MPIPAPPADQPFVRTLRARWLGQQLRALREQRGLTLADVAASTGRPQGLWDRFEWADWPISRGDVTTLLDLYRVHDVQLRERLLTIVDHAWRLHHWDTGDHPDHSEDGADASFITLDWLIRQATKMQIFATVLPVEPLPSTADPTVPVELVIAETALRPEPGDALVHQLGSGRLTHLVSLPYVQVQVLANPTARQTTTGGFTVFRFHHHPPVAYQHTLAGHHYLEGRIADRTIEAYRALRTSALDAGTSHQLIEKAAAQRT